jgi:uncharacterized protein YlxW (UPF0749 family)
VTDVVTDVVSEPEPPEQPSTSPRTRTPALLLDLVNEHLDPGYAAAARRRGDDSRRRWYDRPAVAVGCLLAGFVLVVGYLHAHRSAPAAAQAHTQLVQRVRAAQATASGLATQLSGVENSLARAQASVLPAAGAAGVQRDRVASGEVAVSGPGMTVTLGEPTVVSSRSAGRAGSQPIGATNILTDRDVRSVVNQLWADGAEAVAVNGIRLTPTTAIRFAGEAVLVDFHPISSPYRVQAIGDADALSTGFASSDVASRYHTLASADGITFTFDTADHLHLPAAAPALPSLAMPAPSRSPR